MAVAAFQLRYDNRQQSLAARPQNMARNRLKSRVVNTASSSSLAKASSTASGRKRKTYDALEYTRNRMGLKPVIETRPGTHSDPELSWWPRMRLILREPLLEFWGVLVMMLLGGSVTAVTVSTWLLKQSLDTLPTTSYRPLSTSPRMAGVNLTCHSISAITRTETGSPFVSGRLDLTLHLPLIHATKLT